MIYLGKYNYNEYDNGIEIIDSYKVFWDKETINNLYANWHWKRNKLSLYIEWFIHTLCYKLGYQRDRAKDCFFEYNKSWFKNLFK